MTNRFRMATIVAALVCVPRGAFAQVARTEITKWAEGKKAAVSLTYDDGTLNQFRVAVPLMDRFGFPATVFIITGEVAGSRYHGTFVGRPPETIVTRAGEVFDEGGDREKAYRILDEAYSRVREGATALSHTISTGTL